MLISRFKEDKGKGKLRALFRSKPIESETIEDKIKALENDYKIQLPNIYRRFLIKYNGGDTPKTEFCLNRIHSNIEGFYGFASNRDNYNIDKQRDYLFFDDFINDHFFPIAENAFGDFIVINLSKEKEGEICFYYHDRPKRYIHLADDLVTFIGKCKSEKIRHIRTIEERKEIYIKNWGNKIPKATLAGWQAEIDFYKDIHQEECILP